MIIFCETDSCVNNCCGGCQLLAIELEIREGDFKDGKREIFSACKNYKETTDGTD